MASIILFYSFETFDVWHINGNSNSNNNDSSNNTHSLKIFGCVKYTHQL